MCGEKSWEKNNQISGWLMTADTQRLMHYGWHMMAVFSLSVFSLFIVREMGFVLKIIRQKQLKSSSDAAQMQLNCSSFKCRLKSATVDWQLKEAPTKHNWNTFWAAESSWSAQVSLLLLAALNCLNFYLTCHQTKHGHTNGCEERGQKQKTQEDRRRQVHHWLHQIICSFLQKTVALIFWAAFFSQT